MPKKSRAKTPARRSPPVTRLRPGQFTARLKSGQLTSREITAYRVKVKDQLTERQRQLIHQARRLTSSKAREKRQAKAARDSYRPRKSDRGKIVLVGLKGGKAPEQKGRKGYPVYVTRTGKKRLLRQKAERPFKISRLRDVKLKASRNLRKAQAKFERSRLEETARGRALLRGQGSVQAGGANDFRGEVIKTIARSLKKTIEAQESHRSFLIRVGVLLRHGDGTSSRVEFEVPIDKADHIAIRQAGLENFVSQKLYAALAQQLAYMGFITAGSANHIRRVQGIPPEEELTEEDWEQYHQEQGRSFTWSAPRFEQVTMEKIEWIINQAR